MINKIIFHAILTLAHLAGSWCFGAELISIDHRFAQGPNPLKSALQAPNTNGGSISGVGNGDWVKHPTLQGLGSWVYPLEQTAEPLITLTGTNWHVHDLSLHGYEPEFGWEPNITLPAAGILVRFAKGVGTGGIDFERLNISNVSAAIQFGVATDSDAMCDTSGVRKLNVDNVDYAVLQTRQMAMQNNFSQIVAKGVRKAMFRLAEGGNNSIRDCSMILVDPADGEQTAYISIGSPGSNNWTYSVANGKLDKQCGADACFLDMDKPLNGTLTAIGCQVAYVGYGKGKHLWNLHDSIRIVIVGGSGLLQKHAINVKRDWPGFNPPIIVAINHENCASPEDMVAPGSAPVYIHCVSCGTQQSNLPGRRMMTFSFNNVIDRSKEAVE